jgi:alcohol dehydrogenase class IV
VARILGSRIVWVSGSGDRGAHLRGQLERKGVEIVHVTVSGEPDLETVRREADRAAERHADLVVAVGGGSVIDAGKAIAALANNPGDALDYLEVIGKGLPLDRAPLPIIAAPTTAGTGSEVTRNAVLTSREHRVKVSLRHQAMLPWWTFVDPELTRTMPPAVTAASGLDALTQLIEAFVSAKANPMTDALCREALPRAARALPKAFVDGDNMDARRDMALAALFGGLALANGGLGAAHGLAGPLGGMTGAPHGALCAALIGPAIRTNLAALAERTPDHPALLRYDELALFLTGDTEATGVNAAGWVETVAREFGVTGLSAMGLAESDISEAVEKAKASSSMKGNPVELTDGEVAETIRRAM